MAEEINAQVLQKLLTACCAGKEIKNLSSWTYGIARNTTIDELKKQGRYCHERTELPDEEVLRPYQDLEEFVEPLMGFLPDKYAEPLRMADIEGVKHEVIAKKLGLSLSGVKSRIQRARKLLKAEIDTCFYQESADPNRPEGFQLKPSCTSLRHHIRKEG